MQAASAVVALAAAVVQAAFVAVALVVVAVQVAFVAVALVVVAALQTLAAWLETLAAGVPEREPDTAAAGFGATAVPDQMRQTVVAS